MVEGMESSAEGLTQLDPAFVAQQLFSMAGIEETDQSFVIEASDRGRANLVIEANAREISRLVGFQSRSTVKNEEELRILELLNQCLVALSLSPLPFEVFSALGGSNMLRSKENLAASVDEFRKFSIFHFGGFRRGFASVTAGKVSLERFQQLWTALFRDGNPKTLDQFKDVLAGRAKLSGIAAVDGDALWALGYLAPEHAPDVNRHRETLLPHIGKARAQGVKDYADLERAILADIKAAGGSKPAVDAMVNRAHLPDDACLFNVPEGIFGPYNKRLERAERYCQLVSQTRISELKEKGRQNTFVYLTTGDIDVYVATSMRNPEHFTTTAAFIRRLFDQANVRPLGLRYFDPTQAFCHDRFDKGLLEILMIHRSKITVYHAQEQDTFGKDSEASLSMVAGKPVIVYVTRLFSRLEQFGKMYAAIDECQKPVNKSEVLSLLRERNLLSRGTIQELAPPEFTKSHVVAAIVDQYAKTGLERVEEAAIHGELYIHGYRFPPPKDWEGLNISDRKNRLVEYAVDRIKALERRALTFREGHPLSLQASPFDGVARGVFVTRSVDQTADVLHRVLLGIMHYNIRELDYAWALYDEVTDSPVRIVTKDKTMTHAFWMDFRDPVPLGFS